MRVIGTLKCSNCNIEFRESIVDNYRDYKNWICDMCKKKEKNIMVKHNTQTLQNLKIFCTDKKSDFLGEEIEILVQSYFKKGDVKAKLLICELNNELQNLLYQKMMEIKAIIDLMINEKKQKSAELTENKKYDLLADMNAQITALYELKSRLSA